MEAENFDRLVPPERGTTAFVLERGLAAPLKGVKTEQSKVQSNQMTAEKLWRQGGLWLHMATWADEKDNKDRVHGAREAEQCTCIKACPVKEA